MRGMGEQMDPVRPLDGPRDASGRERAAFAIDAGLLVVASFLIAGFATLRLHVLGYLAFWFVPMIPTIALLISSIVWALLYFRLIRLYLGRALWLLPTIAGPCLLALVTIEAWEDHSRLPEGSDAGEPAVAERLIDGS